MRGITLFVGIVLLLVILLTVEPSRAQETTDMGCWRRITNCMETASHITGCCTTFEEEIKNERDCFCVMKEHVLTDPEFAASMDKSLAVCGFSESFLTICSGTGSNSSSPSMPSTPKVPRASPTVTPSTPLTPSGQDELPCWGRISTCLSDDTTTLESCCAVMTEEIDNERECFCDAKPLLDANATVSNGLAQILSFCSISTFDSLCSAGAPSSPGRTTSPPLSPGITTSPPLGPPSPMLFSDPPGTQKSPNGTLTPAPPVTAESMEQSGSNKIVVSVGLLLPQALLVIICATMLLS